MRRRLRKSVQYKAHPHHTQRQRHRRRRRRRFIANVRDVDARDVGSGAQPNPETHIAPINAVCVVWKEAMWGFCFCALDRASRVLGGSGGGPNSSPHERAHESENMYKNTREHILYEMLGGALCRSVARRVCVRACHVVCVSACVQNRTICCAFAIVWNKSRVAVAEWSDETGRRQTGGLAGGLARDQGTALMGSFSFVLVLFARRIVAAQTTIIHPSHVRFSSGVGAISR